MRLDTFVQHFWIIESCKILLVKLNPIKLKWGVSTYFFFLLYLTIGTGAKTSGQKKIDKICMDKKIEIYITLNGLTWGVFFI